MTSKNLQRIEWIDLAKGISILLVVLGHSILAKIPFLGDWFASFLMPFFFFVSGLLFNPNKRFLEYIGKKSKSLGIPFVIFSIIVIIGYTAIEPESLTAKSLHIIKNGWGGYALWFIPVLFFTNIIYYIVCKLSVSKIYRFCMLIALACIGYCFSIYSIPNLWNLNFALTAVLFYGIGNLLADKLNDIFNKSQTHVALLTIFAVVISCVFLFDQKPEFFINRLRGG